MKKLALLLGLFSIMVFFGSANASTYTCGTCADCQSIIQYNFTNGDTLLLNASFNATAEVPNCFSVDKSADYGLGIQDVEAYSNYTIDCRGYTVDGSDVLGTYNGITLGFSLQDMQANNITMKNCIFNGFGLGVRVQNADNVKIINSSSQSTILGTGIQIRCAGGFTLNNILLSNNLFSSTYYGLELYGYNGGCTPINFTMEETSISGASISGIWYDLPCDTSDLFYNNFLNNTNNIFIASGNCSWNTTTTTATNIVGGNQIGGNFWALPNGTGFSQTCTNVNNDSFCDSSYALDGSNTDFLPLTNNIPVPSVSCNSCASCTSAIAGATTGDIIQMNSSFVADGAECSGNPNGECIGIYQGGITLDCQNFNIDDGAYGNCVDGIHIEASNGIIKNCIAHAFESGIRIGSGSNNTITDSKAYNNTDSGFYTNANNNIFTNVQGYNNFNGGITIDGGNGNRISDSVFYGNTLFAGSGATIYGYDSSYGNNTMTNITIYENKIGIRFLMGGQYNVINDSRIYNNSNTAFLFDWQTNFNPNFNFIYNNIVNESSAFYLNNSDDTAEFRNYFNTTSIAGTNIVGGNRIGGNYWARPNSTGFSQTCTNANSDAFCDDALSFEGATDFLPLTLNSPSPPSPTPLINNLGIFGSIILLLLGAGVILFLLQGIFSGSLRNVKDIILIIIGAIIMVAMILALL